MTPAEREMCARWWADRLKVPNKREAFETALSPKLVDGMLLSVDYDPDDTLLAALNEAGIECAGEFFSAINIFPTRTLMKIKQHGSENIVVKEGYLGDFVYLSILGDV